MDRSLSHCTGSSDQSHLQGKGMEKGKMVILGGLTSSKKKKKKKKKKEKKRSKSKREKERYAQLKYKVPKNSKER